MQRSTTDRVKDLELLMISLIEEHNEDIDSLGAIPYTIYQRIKELHD